MFVNSLFFFLSTFLLNLHDFSISSLTLRSLDIRGSLQFNSSFYFSFSSFLCLSHREMRIAKKNIQELLKNVIASFSGKNKPQVSTHTIAMEFVRKSKVWILIDDKMLFILELKAISIYFPSGFLVVLFLFLCVQNENFKIGNR